jgi:Flp pilus assembly pilin Flp
MDSPILRIAKSSVAVEQGLLIAGITVTGVAVLQTIGIMLFWLLTFGN